jgi:hypothetical protein
MRYSQILNENNAKLAKHYTDVLNTRYVPYDIPLKITTHFVDRINDSRNTETISIAEVADFFSKLLIKRKNYLQDLPEGTAVQIVDLETDITIPFKKVGGVIMATTIMRGGMRQGAQRKVAI